MGDFRGSENKLGIHTASAAGVPGYVTSSHWADRAARLSVIHLLFTDYRLTVGTKTSLCKGML